MERVWKKKFGVLLMLALGVFLSTPAHALTCGQTVTGLVTLTADMTCNNTSGLLIQSDNVIINLNGHTITCVSATGYRGSCQIPTTGVALGNAGITIASPGFPPATTLHGVAIVGPGTISGFAYGVQAVNAMELLIDHVTVTGPDGPLEADSSEGRSYAAGISLLNIECLPSAGSAVPSVIVASNDISNQSTGLYMNTASCVLVEGNNIHDNAGTHKDFYSFGIELTIGSQNVIYGNQVLRNGDNGYQGNFPAIFDSGWDGGIVLIGPNTSNNLVDSNNVVDNCGDGIAMDKGAEFNVVTHNTMVGSSTDVIPRQCVTVPVGTFFDAAERQTGFSTWTTNNTCHTQTPLLGITANVCQ